jgi:hypothetical protein
VKTSPTDGTGEVRVVPCLQVVQDGRYSDGVGADLGGNVLCGDLLKEKKNLLGSFHMNFEAVIATSDRVPRISVRHTPQLVTICVHA